MHMAATDGTPHDSVRLVRAPTPDDLELAWRTVSAVLEPSPLVSSDLAPSSSLKLETFQPTGSFKVRGGLAAISALPAGQRPVTASAGNHGLGVAWAAARLGRPATVVVPEHSSPAKVDKLRTFPIELIEHGIGYEAAELHALELGAAEGITFVSPYNDPTVIAGQSTIGRELDTQAPGELTVVAPVGGGGLLSGLTLWSHSRPNVHIAGVESSQSLAVSAAVRAGRIVRVPVGDTIADGLAANLEPGAVTPGLVTGVPLVSVSDDELFTAMKWLFTHHGLVAEGSGAAGIAAVLSNKVHVEGQLVVVITGRNIAATRYAHILQSN